jgi:plastocyanin domain-containing protein
MVGRALSFVLIVAGILAVGCAGGARRAESGRFEIAVTEKGFEPTEIKVAAGRPITLVVTRETTKTCATELILKDYGINRELPLGQAVEITFTPEKPGKLRYACAMDMIAGTIVVE